MNLGLQSSHCINNNKKISFVWPVEATQLAINNDEINLIDHTKNGSPMGLID